MTIDLEYLRLHYASLSDKALLAVDRTELVEAAQKCYADELGRRQLTSSKAVERHAPPTLSEPAGEEAEDDAYPVDDADKPEWLEEAAEVYSRTDLPGAAPADDIVDARDALEAAGIPCYLDLSEIPEETNTSPKASHVWRVMVPGNFNQRATSILDRDIFNSEFENEWRTHLETLSDEELREMDPKVVFCGLFDRVDRVTKAFGDEIAGRGLKSEPG